MNLARVDDGSTSTGSASLRVLHVYAGNLYGGVEASLRAIALQRTSVPEARMDFALCYEGRLADELRGAGATVHMLGAVRFRSPRSVRAARSTLHRVLRENPYEVVACHSSWPHAVFAPVVRKHGERLAHYMHNPPDGRGWVDRWAGSTRPDLVVCNSVFTQEAGSWLFAGVPRRVVHCPVLLATGPAPARAKTRLSLGTGDSAIVIVHASRMQEWKGHRLLLSALAELRSEPRWVCWFAGAAQRPSEAAYEADLRATVSRLGLADRVFFIGQRDDIPAILQAADIHCQPNASPEPYGVVFIEALAAGLPVVTTAMGGPLEIVDSSCGVLVPPNDATALAAALGALVRDDKRRATMSKFGPARARQLSDPASRTKDLTAALSSLSASPPMDARARASLSGGMSNAAIHSAVAAVLRARGATYDSIVDIGCGRGDCARSLRGMYGTYVGCDVVRYDDFPGSGPVVFCEADLNRPPFPLPDASAAAVVSIETIEHVENPRAVVREMTRIVRPGGWVVVTTPNQISLASKMHLVLKDQFQAFQRAPGLYPAHITALVPEDLRRIAEESGLVDIEIGYTDHGRVPFSEAHWPASLGARGRWFSDNVILVARRR